jgi:hypothetical protein
LKLADVVRAITFVCHDWITKGLSRFDILTFINGYYLWFSELSGTGKEEKDED